MYVIGTKPFTEQYILAALIEQRLRDGRDDRAARARDLAPSVIFEALRAGEIDVYVDYSGTIWSNQFQRTDAKPRAGYAGRDRGRPAERDTPSGLLGPLGFENAYALAMAAGRAQSLGVRSIADLASRARNSRSPATTNSSAGRNGQALRRPTASSSAKQRQMQPEFMYPAAAPGEVDVIAAYTSDGRIAQFTISRCSTIRRRAIPPYDACC